LKYLLFIIFLTLPLACLSQEISLEPIFIEKSFSSASLASTDYFYSDDVQSLPFFSPEEIIDYSSSVDLRKRSGSGIQSDVSLRGSIFEDTSIRIGGLEINDPQTGHFNLEIPLTSADIQEVEIFKNSQTINFSLKKPKKEGALLESFYGQHALNEQLLSINFPLKEFSNRLSVEHKVSSGGRQDSDFEIYNFSYHSLLEDDSKEIEFLFAATQRDFGAADFYSVKFPHQEEHITQELFSLSGKTKNQPVNLTPRLYLRRHSDKFILNRHNPPFYTNYHTTYVYGLDNQFDFSNGLFFGLNIEREKVTSTNLKNHRRLNKGFSLGAREKRIGDLAFDLNAGLNYYESFQYLDQAHLGLRYFFSDDFSLRFSFDRIWRAPSFTELYYVSSTDVGNSSLGAQQSNNFELGTDLFLNQDLRLSLNSFLRNQHDTIDWVKNTSSAAWQANNVGTVNAYGLDCSLEAELNILLLEKINFSYTYLALDKESAYNFSKYVFDYDRHKLVSRFKFDLKGVDLNTVVNFSHPLTRKNYTTVDLKAEKKFGQLSLILEGNNIFNRSYQEMADISTSGRWYKCGLSYSF